MQNAIINQETQQQEYIIHTTGQEPTIQQIQIAADKRGDDIPEAEKIRRIVLDATSWGTLAATHNGQPLDGMASILIKGLRTIASARLREYLGEQPLARTIPASFFTVPSLIEWNTEDAATSGSMTYTKEQVLAWYKTSKVHERLTSKGAAAVDYFGGMLAKSAAKNAPKTIKPAEALKMMTLIEDDCNQQHANPLSHLILQRLQYIADYVPTRKAESKTISMDDL